MVNYFSVVFKPISDCYFVCYQLVPENRKILSSANAFKTKANSNRLLISTWNKLGSSKILCSIP